ncbi:hypothetical protein KOW79_009309 [Hemibagrus wyckioides]|uniref:Gastrin/cholecystokinin peptide hormone domain-containing protein n=1 Tax=Hemibagrus wyckioides TaxID=337641 RepID=A0A9D3NUT9_9TELE|nr:uncharacterized protein LOC131360943 [Hemibagrus wyckioides]KAG7327703.1 hypothetical protein KOW79_009309 [Hemibagrus wyckioides]
MAANFQVLGFIVIVAMVFTCTASPLLSSAREAPKASESREIRGLQVQRGAQSGGARTERFAPLPEDQRRFTSKQILQALSEIIQRDDCISDYQGWVDFGRRSTD